MVGKKKRKRKQDFEHTVVSQGPDLRVAREWTKEAARNRTISFQREREGMYN